MRKTQHNLLVGAKVVLDYGHLWRDVRPEIRESEHADVKVSKKDYYGRSGVIIDYDREEAKILVRMDDDGTTSWHFRGVANIQELPGNDTDNLLREILKALQSLK